MIQVFRNLVKNTTMKSCKWILVKKIYKHALWNVVENIQKDEIGSFLKRQKLLNEIDIQWLKTTHSNLHLLKSDKKRR